MLNKIKGKIKTNGNLKIIISLSVIVLLIVLIAWLLNANFSKEKSLDVLIPIPEASMEIGDVGILEEGKTVADVNPEAVENPIRPLNVKTPNNIFNTAGTILDIQSNSIVIRGNGSNFDDQINRNLTIVINETTKVNGVKGDLTYFQDNLNVGDRIMVEAPYNIHGKDLFLVSYVNTIKK